MLRVWVHGCEPGRASDGSRLALCQTLSIECPSFIFFWYSRCPGLPASSLPVCPVYQCFCFVPPRHPGLPVVCRYTGVVHFFMLAEPLLLLHTPTHAAAAHNTRCCTIPHTPPPPFSEPSSLFGPLEKYAESCGISGAAYHLRKAKMDFIHARSSKPAVQADIRAMFSDS